MDTNLETYWLPRALYELSTFKCHANKKKVECVPPLIPVKCLRCVMFFCVGQGGGLGITLCSSSVRRRCFASLFLFLVFHPGQQGFSFFYERIDTVHLTHG